MVTQRSLFDLLPGQSGHNRSISSKSNARSRRSARWGLTVSMVLLALFAVDAAAERQAPDPYRVAQQIDGQGSKDSKEKTAGDSAADAAYLNRVWLDLVGSRPRETEVEAFCRNRAADKRQRVVDRLLEDERFGLHWGGYWRDVILARRADERALRLVADGLVDAFASRLNRGDGWDEVARSFITASGDVREHGETGLFLAQKGEPENITAEISRIFLGMQIQCAQCHDHPTDEWKREQFHQLAAFFPRINVRPVRNVKPRSFEVVSRNKKGRGKKGKNRKRIEHYMPDLADPESPGQITKPVFFLTGHSLELGTEDQTRRQALAGWLTDAEENPWFATAYVNRIWTELTGEGFYDSVDDIGPGRDCRDPELLALLADHFVDSGYDTKWLLRTIMATAAYRSFDSTADTATPSRPLRGDVVFDNLLQLLEVDQNNKRFEKQKRGARQRFQQTFFYDPSLPRDEVNPTIPQALLMMNGPQIHQLLRGDRRGTMLARLLDAESDDGTIIESLYLRSLGRVPTDTERATCRSYIAKTNNRVSAYEDILWALINTAEFRHRH
ncbi:MAG: DUF1549 domain-containing protein [Planctomycetota bacterium]|nr:DUF1549 domain-containing protein [Planctomycetota bacterium]